MNCKPLAAFALALFVPTAVMSSEPTWRTQLPLPFGAPRFIPGQQCTPDYQKILKLQVQAFRALQRLTQKEGETLCSTLESVEKSGVEKFLDPKALEPLLTPQQREWLGALGIDLSKVDIVKLMRMLGIDISQIDLRQLKDHCRASQGDLDRFASGELKRVEGELIRCEDRV